MYLALPTNIHVDTVNPPTSTNCLWLCTTPVRVIPTTGTFIEESTMNAESFTSFITNDSFQVYEFNTYPVIKFYVQTSNSWEDVITNNTYNITMNMSGCFGYSTNPTEIDEGDSATLYFQANAGYSLPTSIYVSGAEYDWNWSVGELILRNPTGSVYVSISCAGNCCFAAGTPVLMSNGTFKNIENIVAGDIVMTFNEESEVYEPGTVIYFFVKPNTQDMAKLIFEDGTEITMNAYHPMYTTDGWKSLTGSGSLPILTREDTILSTDKKWVKISDIVRWFSDEYITTYNLDVENNDNYFVGKTPVMASNVESCFIPSPGIKPASV